MIAHKLMQTLHSYASCISNVVMQRMLDIAELIKFMVYKFTRCINGLHIIDCSIILIYYTTGYSLHFYKLYICISVYRLIHYRCNA